MQPGAVRGDVIDFHSILNVTVKMCFQILKIGTQ